MPTIADIGFAFSHETRVQALEALMSGRMLTNGDLASGCRVPASSMSEHLAVLLNARLVRAVRSGRHRYYAIASEDAAALMEAAGLLARPLRLRTLPDSERSRMEAEARMCYNHLAGRLGVALLKSLIARGELRLTDDVAVVTDRAVVLSELAGKVVSTGSALPCCVDHSERAFHLRGTVAVAIASAFVQRKWVRPGPGRSLILTPQGRDALASLELSGAFS